MCRIKIYLLMYCYYEKWNCKINQSDLINSKNKSNKKRLPYFSHSIKSVIVWNNFNKISVAPPFETWKWEGGQEWWARTLTRNSYYCTALNINFKKIYLYIKSIMIWYLKYNIEWKFLKHFTLERPVRVDFHLRWYYTGNKKTS